ncbi:MAG: c-type cytochrome [Flavobacteriales bacterium]|nr:c-type cytochrome [Flavobacteriales bacterium]
MNNYAELLNDPIAMILIFAVFILLVTILVLLNAISTIVRMQHPETESAKRETAWTKLMKRMTDSTPVEKEHTVMLNHNYDGIRELDNNLPPWWVWGFYISIVFAVVYLLNYHVFKTSPLPMEEYQTELADAEAAIEEWKKSTPSLIDESNVTFLADASALEAGAKIYNINCTQCHLASGGGSVGPNLTDDYYIHGGSIQEIFSIIKYGVIEKGMIPWQTQLSAEEMQQVASYVMSLRGNNVEGGKAPEGELYVPEAEEAAPADSVANPAAGSEQDTVAAEVALRQKKTSNHVGRNL